MIVRSARFACIFHAPALWLHRHNRQCAGAQLTGGRKVWLGAMRAVNHEMVLTLSAAGTADDVAVKISALLKAGC